jgi:hypothetical protein
MAAMPYWKTVSEHLVNPAQSCESCLKRAERMNNLFSDGLLALLAEERRQVEILAVEDIGRLAFETTARPSVER